MSPQLCPMLKVTERKRLMLDAEEIQASTEQYFWVYSRPLNLVPFLKYLGQILMALGDEFTAMVIKPWNE